ncbi:PIG-L deacetylase family protein [Paraburkholderia lycopersici]|uniref:GlcNAc-PI de-N-acetylase n=1 Tax=Paraburkholderia lycopersici TaxID=416944 RepID=A0A1G7CAP5_9BURK|nr:PIG-L family deacetylase [Paraburkholderia lycopersici]SDE36381.1 GlcNAc-PI de-N-acetylase [Paraburkholderia lycopersici]
MNLVSIAQECAVVQATGERFKLYDWDPPRHLACMPLCVWTPKGETMSLVLPHDVSDGAPRLIVVSPHLDDAVLGCAGLIARCPGSIVCTVFAGEPPAPMHTQRDEASGFADAQEAVRARKREDERALAMCGATPLWLDFLDGQYGATPDVKDVAHLGRPVRAFWRLFARMPIRPVAFRSSTRWRRVPFAAAKGVSCTIYRL